MITIGLLLLSCLIVMPASSEDTINTTSTENTLYVDDDFNESTPGWNVTHFNKIQDGVDHANNNDTVFVYSGNYKTVFIHSKSINLLGENKDSTIIKGNSGSNAVSLLSCSNTQVSSFQIEKGVDGVCIKGGTSNIISDNKLIQNDLSGLGIRSSNWNTVCNNYIVDNYNGITISDGAKNNSIFSNTISNNRKGGIGIAGGDDSNIFQNTIQNNKNGISISQWPPLYHSLRTNIYHNNFFDNQKNIYCGYFSISYTYIDNNYWGRPYFLPYIIYSFKLFGVIPLPSNIDWHPAKEPYNI